MLKMIIADDEVLVRDGLSTVLDWASYGIEVTAIVDNGIDLLRICRELKPDIIMTDIRMPGMDGFEVVNTLHNDGFSPKIIIISGIEDFTYAKNAIHAEALGYILKPIDIDELETVINKTVKRINSELEQHETLVNMQAFIRDNKPLLADVFIRNLILGLYQNEKEIEEKVKYFSINLECLPVIACIVSLDCNIETKGIIGDENIFTMLRIEEYMKSRITEKSWKWVFVLLNEDELIILVDSKNKTKLFNELKVIQHVVKNSTGYTISVGIGSIVQSLKDVNISYKRAKQALKYCFLTGNESIIDYNDIKQIAPFDSIMMFRSEDSIINAIRQGNKEETITFLNNAFSFISKDSSISVEFAKLFALHMLFLIENLINELYEKGVLQEDSYETRMNQLISCRNFDEMKKVLFDAATQMAAKYSSFYFYKSRNIVRKIEFILQNRYAESLSIKKIANELYFSPSYVRALFKKEKGISIMEYLTNIRIEKAKQLILMKNLKIYEVAEAVGYKDTNHFSRVFKNRTGVYPSQFSSNKSEQ